MTAVDITEAGAQPGPPEGSPQTAKLDISVVMPCLNEAGSVGVCVAKAFDGIRRTGLTGEVVVADNGSSDGSADIATLAGARVVHEPRRGYGNAYLKGFAEAQGRIVVMGDSDDSYDFTQIPALIAPIEAGADYVLGSRFRGQIKRGAMTWSHRYIGNPVLTGMLNVLFGLEASDAHSGLRAFRREALQQMGLRCSGMELASEIVVKAARAGLKVAEVPITYHPRTGESKLNSLRDGWRHMRFLLVLSALRVFLWPGFTLFWAGVAAQALLLGLGLSELGLRLSTAAVCVMLLGMQLMVLGLFSTAYAHYAGLEDTPMSGLVERKFTLERGLLASGLVSLLGAIVLVGPLLGVVGGRWFRPELEGIAAGVIFLGGQLAFCSFLLGSLPAPFERTRTPQAITLP
jgi:glycosyltransferase involved in cell wall biosynthesis